MTLNFRVRLTHISVHYGKNGSMACALCSANTQKWGCNRELQKLKATVGPDYRFQNPKMAITELITGVANP